MVPGGHCLAALGGSGFRLPSIGRAAKPGEPAFQEPGEPPRPIPVEEICGPRKPGQHKQASSSGSTEQQTQGPPAKIQKFKAPPAGRTQNPLEGPPPQAAPPAQTGQASAPAEVAAGATSKAAAKPGGKRPPPTLAEANDQNPPQAQPKDAPPARVPAVAAAPVEGTPAAMATPSAGPADTLQQAASAPVPEQLEAVAKAAQILTAHGFALTQAQEVALKAHAAKTEEAAAKAASQWAGYRPGQPQDWAGYRSEQQQPSNKWTTTGKWSGHGGSASASSWQSGHASTWQTAEWGQEPRVLRTALCRMKLTTTTTVTFSLLSYRTTDKTNLAWPKPVRNTDWECLACVWSTDKAEKHCSSAVYISCGNHWHCFPLLVRHSKEFCRAASQWISMQLTKDKCLK
eukprot:5475108-Amphidinium_carterae.1